MNIALCGLGKAGKAFVEYTNDKKEYNLKTVLCRSESETAGKTVTDVTNIHTKNQIIIKKINEFTNEEKIDVLIDFSNSNTTLELIDMCCKYRINIVICPTAFSDEQLMEFKRRAIESRIGIVFAPTLTVGINMLIDFVAKLSALFKDFSFEIIEKHSKFKSSPTKTAQIISNTINRDEVNISSIRLDGYVGEHEVIATNGNERISIVHESFERTAFVNGALLAANYICGKTGYFEMRDIFKDMIMKIHNETY